MLISMFRKSRDILAFNGIATECYVALNVLTLIDVLLYEIFKRVLVM